MNKEFLEEVWSSLEENTDDTYLLNDTNDMKKHICGSPKEGRKAFVFYTDNGGNVKSKCEAAYRGVSKDNNVDSLLNVKGSLVEDVLNVSCF